MLTLASLAAALGGEVSGDQVLAPGPGHSPEDRSLSVKLVGDDVVVHSFAGDDFRDAKDYVREKVGLDEWKPNGAKSPITAEYIYRLADDTPYLQVKRTRDKKFWQSHWTGSRWERGKPNGPKIPYRLPQLAKADAVFICEGEKDADRVASLGLAATTASEGAGKWAADLERFGVARNREL